MKANEMQRYRYQNDFPNDYDGIVDDKDGELVFYEDAMQVIQALEAKIKGMIERPKVDITRLTYPSGKEVWYVKLNRHTLLQGDGYHSKTMAEMEACRIADALGVTPEFQKTKALGMEGDK